MQISERVFHILFDSIVKSVISQFTKATTTTSATTVKTTKKANKTEVKDDNNIAYEEPAQQDTSALALEPEPEPEDLVAQYGCYGTSADDLYYAMSQGCNERQAAAYAAFAGSHGRENVFIGNPVPDNPES